MATEIERKFFIPSFTGVPAAVLGAPTRLLQQFYLTTGELLETRVRDDHSDIELGFKVGSGEVRTKFRLPFSRKGFDWLQRHRMGATIQKARRVYSDRRTGLDIEIDQYILPQGAPYAVAEVEFSGAGEARAFEPLSWFGPEVTGLSGWSNADIALGKPRKTPS